MIGVFYYKLSRVKGEVYMQIWKRNLRGKDEYVVSLGSALKCLKLVKPDYFFAQTNSKSVSLTNSDRGLDDVKKTNF